jgi:hypothetical protein
MIPLDGKQLYIRSMGKALRVVAIAESDEEANRVCARTDAWAVVATLGSLVLIADKYDPGTVIPRTAIGDATGRS